MSERIDIILKQKNFTEAQIKDFYNRQEQWKITTGAGMQLSEEGYEQHCWNRACWEPYLGDTKEKLKMVRRDEDYNMVHPILEDSQESYITKDSGKRVEYASGMRRDTDDGKARYDLIPVKPLQRLAELYTRGAIKYGEKNWEKANSPEELQRFEASGLRHFYQYLAGEKDEDHLAAVCFNVMAIMYLKQKLK